MQRLRSSFLRAIARSFVMVGALSAAQSQAALIGYWGLDESVNPSSGTTALDYSPSIINGTYQPLGGVGGPVVGIPGATPDSGTAANFNGTTDEIFLGLPNALRLSNNFTIAAWIKPDVTPTGTTQRIFSQNTNTGGTGYGFGIIGNELKFTTYGRLDYTGDANDAFTVPIGQWTHVAAVMGSDNSVTFYQNGRFVRRVTGSFPANANSGNRNYFIGTTANTSTSTSAERFDGSLDDIQIYNNALTLTEIRALYGLPQTQALIGHWKLDETVNPSGSTIAADSSGNGRNGTYQPLTGVDAGPDVGVFGAPKLVGSTAADFNGTTDEVFLGSPTAFRQKNDFTIMAWINPDVVTPGRTQRIFSQNGGGYGFGIIGSELKFTTYGIKDYEGNTADAFSVPAGAWSHIAVVFDEENDARFYLNGIFVEEIDGINPANVGTSNFFIGSTGTQERFGGLIDDLRFYQGSLTQEQILQAAAIPEPTTLALGAFGLIALVAVRKRKN